MGRMMGMKSEKFEKLKMLNNIAVVEAYYCARCGYSTTKLSDEGLNGCSNCDYDFYVVEESEVDENDI
jgi:protein-arginine kinase activator protein McsA